MKKGLTLVELLISIAILGIVAGVLVQSFPGMFRANRNATTDMQLTSVARAYLENIRSQWKTMTNTSTTLTLTQINSVVDSTAGLSASLTVKGRDWDSDTPSNIQTCSSILTTACTASSSARRWIFTLTLSTGDQTQSYPLELGR